MEINQYDIVLVNLDPTVGSEIKKTRPCAVISPNEINHNLRTTIIAPLTSKSRAYPTRVKISQNGQDGWLVLDQIRTIDKTRIIKKFAGLSTDEIKACKKILQEMLVD